jgi:CRP-like cAMP-binding protein
MTQVSRSSNSPTAISAVGVVDQSQVQAARTSARRRDGFQTECWRHSEVMEWPVLASLPVEERRGLVAGLRRRFYLRDEVIFHQGDPADTLHLMAAGRVSVRVTLRGGEFVVVAILGPGDAFGEIALVGGPSTRGATIIALERCETLSLGRDEFHRLRTSYPGVDRFLVELLSTRVERLNNYLLEALYVPAERRVLRRLLDLCELYTGDDQSIVIPVTQEMLASLAGTTRPTANQVLRRLVASHIVAVSRSQIVVLDRQSLQQRAG